jgi:hypothetical protein
MGGEENPPIALHVIVSPVSSHIEIEKVNYGYFCTIFIHFYINRN